MRRVTPNKHHLEYGEVLSWSPPAGADKFILWTMSRIHSHDDSVGGSPEVAYGGAAPAWTEAGGYDIGAGDAITDKNTALGTGATVTATGAAVPWQTLVALAGGVQTEVVQVIAYDTTGKATQIDRYSVPAQSSTDAAVIAAQERRVLQSLLIARERAASTGGVKRRGGSADEEEFENIAVIDRRVAELRARIVWFEQAAAGNTLPRQEFW